MIKTTKGIDVKAYDYSIFQFSRRFHVSEASLSGTSGGKIISSDENFFAGAEFFGGEREFGGRRGVEIAERR
jgi:hypothetical protein